MSESELHDKRPQPDAVGEDDAQTKRFKSDNQQESMTQDLSIREPDVGITGFVSLDHSGFIGQIKQRYTDFLVNEIGLDGKVVHLNDKGFNIPKKPKPSQEEKQKKREEEAAQRAQFQLDPELRKQLVDMLDEEDVQKIECVFKEAQTMETKKFFDDKTDRTNLHILLRKAFNNELESVTTETNTFKIARNNRNSRVNKQILTEQNKDANGVENWGYGPSKEFIHFTLHKENKDTMQAVNLICKFLRIPTKMIRYAGTKDRRGVTVQRLSISKIKLDRLNALNKTLRGMLIGGYEFKDESLNLGDLSGNEFIITIRDVKTKESSTDSLEDTLSKGCESINKNGFINYFGMQRFGTFSISTHVVGRELLMENWEKAANLILSDQENVLPKSKEARQYWEKTKDAAGTLKIMPHDCMAEKALLYSLASQEKESSGDYSSNSYYIAIMKIPRNLRTMYVHAYQSFIWNAVASKRLASFGPKPIVGDLVISEEEQSRVTVEEDSNEFEEDTNQAKFIRARPLTSEDIESGKFTIADIVLPTPGFDIKYPENPELYKAYVDLLAQDNMDPTNMRRKVRDFSMAGSYRNVIHIPQEMEYKIVKYKESTQQLVNTDLEMLNNKRAKDNSQKYMKDKLERYMPDKGGDKTAVVIKFKLGVSAYATMLLRELMKLETSRRGDMCDVSVSDST
ncbi:hypothetical protein TPHA_0D01220 [Tetrapisispora phaffii CBS 4417]|uniref:TRUD domain-containing protein n=1 Tax=Tetrapisispora phaffii (strain ATCC 24235 / CBS 4417 / NBRC 1672 / NRRL Y-8282 / UCD 70-5) TaxID=1071381 RepID=G8BSE2_TETPH|nr:hypothetical protein TPHA_0D01220 [Tetrapisispora phaffii CBS 4417]CCE62763.1 hypothetical protein TPHA_0D01220 [Tetrapisispora phaffii CBS 4417]